MPALVESNVLIPGSDVVIKGFLAYPEGGSNLPGVLVHPEATGMSEQLKGVARRLANEGYAALAYDCYSRQPDVVPGTPYMQIVPSYRKIRDDQALIDLDATMAYFRELPVVDADRTGVIGCCSAYPIVLACHDPKLRAAVSFYNQIYYSEGVNNDTTVAPIHRMPSLWCPWQGHYGDADGGIPVEQVHEVEETLTRFKKPHEIYVYPGAGHGFFNETGQAYHEASATAAWPRVLAFFRQNLGG